MSFFKINLFIIQKQQSDSDGELSYFEAFRDNFCKTQNAKGLMNYMIEADSRVDIFEKFQVNSLFEIMFLAVLEEYGRQGIGYELCKCSIEVAKKLDLNLVTSLFTGRNTHTIGRKLKFDVIFEESFTKFSFQGKSFAESVDDLSLTYQLAAKYLKNN
jgi:hypothetical protein